MSEQTIEQLNKELQSPSPAIRKQAITGLLKQQSNAAYDLLKSVASDSDLNVRYFARDALRKLQSRLLDNLSRADENSQIDTIKMLGEERNADACDFLMEYFEKAPMKVQIFISQSLGMIGDRKALPFLVDRFKSGRLHEFVISTMVKAIGKLGTPAEIPLIAEKLTAEDARLRANTIEALEFIGDRRIVDLVEPMLQDPDPRVKTYAARALLQFGDRKMLERFEALLESEDALVRENAVWALGESGNVAAVKLLKSMLSKKQDQHEALKAISKILLNNPQDELLGIIVRYARHYTAELAETAEETIEKLTEQLGDEAKSTTERKELAELLVRKLSSGEMTEKAVEVIKCWIDIHGCEPQLQERLIELLIEIRNWSQSCDEVAVLIEEFKGQTGRAIELLDSMIAAGAKFPRVYLMKGRILDSMNNSDGGNESRKALAELLAEGSREFNSFAEVLLMKKAIESVRSSEVSESDTKLRYMASCFQRKIKKLSVPPVNEKRIWAARLREILNGRLSVSSFPLMERENLSQNMDAAKELIEKGSDIERKNMAVMLGGFWRALQLESRLTAVVFHNGAIDLFNEKISDSEIVKNVDPDEALLPILGRLYIENEDYAEAIRMFEAILANSPEKIDIHEILVDLFRKAGNRQEMIFELNAIASLRVASNDLKGAKEAYSLLVQECPGEPEYLSSYEQLLKDVISSDKKDGQSRLELSGIYQRQGEFRKALDMYIYLKENDLEVEEAEKGLSFIQNKGRESMDRELESSALEYRIRKGIATSLDDYLLLVESYKNIGKHDRLMARYSEAFQSKPGDMVIRIHIAFLIEKGSWVEAVEASVKLDKNEELNRDWSIELLEKALENVEGDQRIRLLRFLAEQKMEAGHPEEAAKILSEIIDGDTVDIPLLSRYSDIQIAAGMKGGAVNTIRKLCSLKPADRGFVKKLADVLESVEIKDAVLEYQKLLRLEPHSLETADALIRCGNKMISSGKIEDGCKALESVVAIAPENPKKEELEAVISLELDFRTLLEQVNNLLRMAEFDRALELLMEASSRDHFTPIVRGIAESMLELQMAPKGQVHFLLAESYGRTGSYALATEHYDKCMKLAPDMTAAAVKGSAYCFLKLELYEKAFDRLSKLELAQKQFDDYVKGLYYEVGAGLITKGNSRQAKRVLKDLYSFDPHFRDVEKLIRNLEDQNV